ncbi:hypothetical protein Tco_1540270 [Tanacetum coccineum]
MMFFDVMGEVTTHEVDVTPTPDGLRPVDEVRSKFTEFFIDNAEFSKDKDSVEKVLSATKLPEGGNSHSAYSPYHLEGKVNFEGVKNVTP